MSLAVSAVSKGEMVSVSVDIADGHQALSTVVSDVVASSVSPSDSVVVSALVNSHVNNIVDLVRLTDFVTQAEFSSVESSDTLGSLVKGKPLLLVRWVVVLGSESVLVGTNVLSVVQSSVTSHLTLDLESDSRGEWLTWVVVSLLVDIPGLVKTLVALVPVDVSSMGVGVSVNVKASDVDISDVSP